MKSVEMHVDQIMSEITQAPGSLNSSHLLPNHISQVQNSQTHEVVPPIKLVDVKKLLKKPEQEWGIGSSKPESFPKEQEPQPSYSNDKMKQVPNTSGVKTFTNRNTPEDSSKVTVSHVLDCLKVILPEKFDMAKINPNDKLASLIIRYLKLDDNVSSQIIIKQNLQIIIDAAKIKDKMPISHAKHPYSRLDDSTLKVAVTKVFPANFIMKETTSELLTCLCIILKIDVYRDAYHILRSTIKKFSSEDQTITNIIEETHTSPFPSKQTPVGKKHIQANTSRKERRLVHNKKINDKQLSNSLTPVVTEKKEILKSSRKKVSKYEIKDFNLKSIKVEDNLKKDPTYELPKVKVHKVKPKAKPVEKKQCGSIGLETVVEYIEENKSTAVDVLANFRLLFYLCRALSSDSSKRPRLKNVKDALHYINDNNINSSNVKLFSCYSIEEQSSFQKQSNQSNCSSIEEQSSFQKQSNHSNCFSIEEQSSFQKQSNHSNCSSIEEQSSFQKQSNHSNIAHLYNCKKLKMKTVVKLRNLADYRLEDLRFMKNDSKFHKSNGYYSQCVNTCVQQTANAESYSSDDVKKMTCESYKLFRKIVKKKIGDKVTFRVKYADLQPGSIVFAKDFRQLSLGWVKGTIKRTEGPRRYVVQFNNGEMWCCAPEQLRPIPNTLTRFRRPIKPKRIFNL